MSDTETPQSKTKSKRATKPKVDKFNGFKVPPTSRKSTLWCKHIYEMIKEAKPELLQQEDVKNAYNALVDMLGLYETELRSWVPTKYNKYSTGIKFNSSATYGYFGGLPINFNQEYEAWNRPDLKKRFQEESAKIMAVYKPLYNLIGRHVVPYMETKHHELNSKKTLENYHRIMEKYERDIKTHEASIEWMRKELCTYAQKCLDLQKPPNLTKFD
jgi:hypothetical protein